MSAPGLLEQLSPTIAELPPSTVAPLHLFGLVAGAVVFALLWPVVWPATETLDIATETGRRSGGERARRRQGSVVLGGSYNPPHRGHIAMLAHLSKRYERVTPLLTLCIATAALSPFLSLCGCACDCACVCLSLSVSLSLSLCRPGLAVSTLFLFASITTKPHT